MTSETLVRPVVRGPQWRWALRDSGTLIGRSVRHLGRSPEQLMLTIFLPVALLLLFRYLFGGAIDTGSVSYANYVIAGLIAISVTFNSTVTTVAVCNDMLEGVVERFRSMPMASSAVLTGHVVAALVRNTLSVAVMILVGFAVGFSPQAGVLEWLAALGLLLLFMTAISWIATIFGLVARSQEGASGLSMIIVFVPYVSSAFVPPSTMPGVLREIAENQPVTLVIDTVRPLLTGMPVGNTGWLAVLWWGLILVLAVPLAARLFRRR